MLQFHSSSFDVRKVRVEKPKTLQCVLECVTGHPQKLDQEIFELEEFLPDSQNRKEWLPGLYDLRTLRFEFPIRFGKASARS